MKIDQLKSIAEMEAFLTGSQPIAFAVATINTKPGSAYDTYDTFISQEASRK